MPAPSGPPTASAPNKRPLDEASLARQWRRLAAQREAPWLHAEVARRMAERLPIVRLKPAQVLNWQASRSASAALLRQAYPAAELMAVQEPGAAPVANGPWWARFGRRPPKVLAPEAVLPGQAQLVWANMALHGAADPPALLLRWLAALAPEGFVMFSTLGPGSLRALQALFDAQGWGPAFAPFVDMHDLGDMLVASGFAQPVMDQEVLTLHWADAAALLLELRSWGGNVAVQRQAGLRGRGWHGRLLQDLQDLANAQGRPQLELEIVYGHAFKPAPRSLTPGETTVALEDMRQMLRRKPGA